MEQSISYQCPNCGAGLEFDAQEQAFSCAFCRSKLTHEEVLAANSEEAVREREAEREAYNSQMNAYQCPSCGAEIVADAHTAAGSCVYCHNPVVLTGRLSGEMKPHLIVPFRYDKAAAKENFLKFARRKKFVPRSFFSEEQVEHITGIYYPFWITDADSQSTIQAHATRTRIWRVGRVEYTETSNYHIRRSGNIHFEDITTSAFSEADKTMLEGILPYPSELLEEFSMPYLSGYIAKKRNMEREDVGDEVRERMQRYSTTLLRNTVSGYATVQVTSDDMELRQSNWQYSLLPIWMLTYRSKKGKVYTYAMNGSTGKVYGELPISWWKLGALFAGIAVALTAFFTLIGGAVLG